MGRAPGRGLASLLNPTHHPCPLRQAEANGRRIVFLAPVVPGIGAGMALPTSKVPERQDIDAATFTREVLPSYRPVVLRGIIRDWPAVQAALVSPSAISAYLAKFYSGRPVEAFVGPPAISGRFFYSPDMSGFNFQKQQAPLTGVLDYLAKDAEQQSRSSVYIGAASVPDCLPGFSAQNAFPLLQGRNATPRIWIGNKTTVSTHYDVSDNVACVVGGRRRFILFPPGQVANLYVGPLDQTMAGQPASMVSVHDPDFERYPRFRTALDNAMVADLEPGDAIYIPPLWWHHVDALDPMNVLVNYWWEDQPADAGAPFEAMVHGILAVSQLSEERRDAWREMFDNFVFQRNGDPAEHLPRDRRGVLAPSTPQLRARIRQFLLKSLSRYQ